MALGFRVKGLGIYPTRPKDLGLRGLQNLGFRMGTQITTQNNTLLWIEELLDRLIHTVYPEKCVISENPGIRRYPKLCKRRPVSIEGLLLGDSCRIFLIFPIHEDFCHSGSDCFSFHKIGMLGCVSEAWVNLGLRWYMSRW